MLNDHGPYIINPNDQGGNTFGSVCLSVCPSVSALAAELYPSGRYHRNHIIYGIQVLKR